MVGHVSCRFSPELVVVATPPGYVRSEVEQGLEAQKEKEKAFFTLAERFRAAADPKEVKQLGDEMGRFVFGE